jgi:hypothetical protein
MLQELQRRNYSDDTIRHHLRAVDACYGRGGPSIRFGSYSTSTVCIQNSAISIRQTKAIMLLIERFQ